MSLAPVALVVVGGCYRSLGWGAVKSVRGGKSCPR